MLEDGFDQPERGPVDVIHCRDKEEQPANDPSCWDMVALFGHRLPGFRELGEALRWAKVTSWYRTGVFAPELRVSISSNP
jgi:hypothetical protein